MSLNVAIVASTADSYESVQCRWIRAVLGSRPGQLLRPRYRAHPEVSACWHSEDRLNGLAVGGDPPPPFGTNDVGLIRTSDGGNTWFRRGTVWVSTRRGLDPRAPQQSRRGRSHRKRCESRWREHLDTNRQQPLPSGHCLHIKEGMLGRRSLRHRSEAQDPRHRTDYQAFVIRSPVMLSPA
jgi:hypothetical protein